MNVDYIRSKPVMRVCVNGQINKCLFYVNDTTDNSAENNYCSCITKQSYTLPNKNWNVYGLQILLLLYLNLHTISSYMGSTYI